MPRHIDIVVEAYKKFIINVISDGRDRCAVGVFSDRLLFMRGFTSDKDDLCRCLDDVEVGGRSRLYDSVCNTVDYMHDRTDKSRPRVIVVITSRGDDASTRSADECREHIIEGHLSASQHSMFLVNIGDCIQQRDELNAMNEMDNFHHIPIASPLLLDGALMKIALKVQNAVPIDCAVIMNNSADTASICKDPAITPNIKIREFLNCDLHPNDRHIFGEFALENYPCISTDWDEEPTVFLVAIDKETRCIVGLLVMLLCDEDLTHIKLVVVDAEHRNRGIGLRLLARAASKNMNKKVTLNVEFDRLHLLKYYCAKGYAKQEEVLKDRRIVVLSLIHLNLFASFPFP